MTDDQLRYNADKPKLSDVFASARALQELDALDGTDLEHIGEQHFLTCATLEIARYLDRGPTASLAYAFVAVIAELERELSPVFDYDANVPSNLVELLGRFPQAFRELCKVYEYGSKKYARGNYRKGAPLTTYLDSALRHILAYGSGETKDVESGCHHLGHALWNLWIAMDQPPVRDDRLPAIRDWYDPSTSVRGFADDE